MDIQAGLYQHFKGKRYRVIGVFRHSESLEELVAYQGLYHAPEYGAHPRWVRPVAMLPMR